ncbi:redoxin domain-containing protein [Dorea sp. D27]|uniref:redoxin domain-containing protein n=1 Tax=Dorea sp. D27 TaxID=658665 RepID=UPI000673ACAC|nr:redoxin domain-containing protein [Dorea sp. D27]KMZ53810.1 putative alkyl hydroperoxide reductase [Dorea sp. D27]
MKANIFIIVMAASLLLAACQSPAGNKEKTEEKAAATAGTEEKKEVFGNYAADALNGIKTNTNTIFDQAELTVVYIWDLSCGSCKEEMETLGDIGREYAGKGVQILGIARGVDADNEEEAAAMAATASADYVQLIATEEMEDKMLHKYAEAPVTIMVGRDGGILGDAVTGTKDSAYWNSEVEKYHSKVCVNDHPADCGVG